MDNKSIYREKWCAEGYDADRFGGSFGRYLQDQEIETFSSAIQGFDQMVLDVGTGTGKLSIPLARRSREIISVDSSIEMLTIARNKAEEQATSLRLAVCDVHALSFKDNTFDGVVCSRVLMHLSDWREGLSELCRVTQGVVVLDFPPLLSFAGLDSMFKRSKRLIAKRTQAYRAFSTRRVMKELKRNNFRIVLLKKQFFLPVVLHRMLNHPRLSLQIENICANLGLVWLFGAPVTVKAIKNSARDYDDESQTSREP